MIERQVKRLVWGGEQELVASDAAELDQLGWSVAITADHAVVGAYGESDYRGAAYVFAKSGDAWIEEQKLVASDGIEADKFGTSVALAGDRALIGTYDSLGHRGAAYVFVKTSSAWIEEQKLVASDGAALDNFGWSLSLSGDRALVGAYGNGTVRGAAYIFVRRGTVWTEEQKLVGSGDFADDNFGWSVSLAGDRALVGAPGTDTSRGAAHVFVHDGGSWREEQMLLARDGVASDNFGTAVSLTDDRALVGAYWDDDLRGAAYVYVRNAGDLERPWSEEQKLVANDGADGNRFGSAVSLSADRALIGASGLGGAYVFARDGSGWSQEKSLLAGDAPVFDLFGWSVALAADQALIGASYTDQLRGAAYVFSLGVDNGDAGAADAGTNADGADGEDGDDAETGSCSRGGECASGYCEDGICCDRTCAASERCRAALKVAGEDGVCGPAKAAAPGATCSFDVQCTSGSCVRGVCCDTDCAPNTVGTGGSGMKVSVGSPPVDDSGCACRAASSPPNRPSAWLGVAVALLLARRMGVHHRDPRGKPERWLL